LRPPWFPDSARRSSVLHRPSSYRIRVTSLIVRNLHGQRRAAVRTFVVTADGYLVDAVALEIAASLGSQLNRGVARSGVNARAGVAHAGKVRVVRRTASLSRRFLVFCYAGYRQ